MNPSPYRCSICYTCNTAWNQYCQQSSENDKIIKNHLELTLDDITNTFTTVWPSTGCQTNYCIMSLWNIVKPLEHLSRSFDIEDNEMISLKKLETINTKKLK